MTDLRTAPPYVARSAVALAAIACTTCTTPASPTPTAQPAPPAARPQTPSHPPAPALTPMAAPATPNDACTPSQPPTAPLPEGPRCDPATAPITPAAFAFGSPSDEHGRADDEPQRTTTPPHPFTLGTTEVTRAQWAALMGAPPNPQTSCTDDRCPATYISWLDALAYLNRLSDHHNLQPCYTLTGCTGDPSSGCPPGRAWCSGDFQCAAVSTRGPSCTGYRLPTEVEWEFAARAGRTDTLATARAPRAACLDGDTPLHRAAWFCANAPHGPRTVATKTPNPWGLYDTLGNAWEWTWDTHPASSTPARVHRGCGWTSASPDCRFANRSAAPPHWRSASVGLRVARTQPANP